MCITTMLVIGLHFMTLKPIRKPLFRIYIPTMLVIGQHCMILHTIGKLY